MNTKMNILKALGIIFVVTGHSKLNLFNWFPPYTFHMALFLFISGYFYKPETENRIIGFTLHKAKTLLVPYYGWNLFYGLFATVLLGLNLIKFGAKISLRNYFIDPWITGSQYIFNLAGWFVITLFLVQIVYVVTRRLLTLFIKSEYCLTLIYFSIGFLGVYLAHHGFKQGLYLILTRTFFAMFFFHLGYLYKIRLEKIDKFSSFGIIVVLLIQTFLLFTVGEHPLFYVMVHMTFDTNPQYFPFITSITGIYLCLQIAKIIDAAVGNRDYLLNSLGNNTWSIMIHHLFAFWLVNVVCWAMNINGVALFQKFDLAAFKTDIFYEYYFAGDLSFLIYVLAGLFIPIVISSVVKHISVLIRFLVLKFYQGTSDPFNH